MCWWGRAGRAGVDYACAFVQECIFYVTSRFGSHGNAHNKWEAMATRRKQEEKCEGTVSSVVFNLTYLTSEL